MLLIDRTILPVGLNERGKEPDKKNNFLKAIIHPRAPVFYRHNVK